MKYDDDFFDSIEFIPIWGNSGIGSYEFWGFKDYDKGHDYVDEIQWDTDLYTDIENDLIREYVIDNFDSIAKRF